VGGGKRGGGFLEDKEKQELIERGLYLGSTRLRRSRV